MNDRKLACLLLATLTITQPTTAQETKDDSRPATTNLAGAAYPRIHPDRRITFQLKAPDAAKVQLSFGLAKDIYEMTRGEGGVWTATTKPAIPGFHYYHFIVGGVLVSDPNSESFYGNFRRSSAIDVPTPGFDGYDLKDVPHGEVRERWYHSKVEGKARRAFVYTPPGYDGDVQKRYPVLYLQHGSGGDERQWGIQGRANFVLDNLIAAGKAKAMLIVMEKGYAARPSDAPQSGKGKGGGSAFEDVVVKDLVPMIDAQFRTKADRDHRAIAGLSMGGGQALQIGLTHLDLFSAIGSFSGPGAKADSKAAYGGAFADVEKFNKRVRLLYIHAGTDEQPFHKNALAFHKSLDSVGIRNVFEEMKGTGHEWATWRWAFYNFAPRLFQE